MSEEKKYGYEIFNEFEDGREILGKDVELLKDYIYHNLNTGYRVKTFYSFSNYLTKLEIVLPWKKARGLELKSRLCEAICHRGKKEGELVNFMSDPSHSIDVCNCGSVWWGEP